MKPKNPFVISGYRGPEFFCDRVAETRKIISALQNERNVTLMAPRRYGKTGLIRNVFNQIKDDCLVIYVDIFSTSNLRDFTELFANAVLGVLDTVPEKALAAEGKFFKSLRPVVSTDSSGQVSFSLSVEASNAESTLKNVFEYLASKDKRVVIAIDEFQQILQYPEKGTEALLRGYIQFTENANFIFAGSRHHLMGEMFTSPRRPFYQSTDILELRVIARDAYRLFAEKFFQSESRHFDKDAFDALYDRFDGITWYIQSVLNRLWANGDELTCPADVDRTITDVLEDRALTFHDLLAAQNEVARLLLTAIAKERKVPEITANAFLTKHGIAAPSSARTALPALLENDLVYKADGGYVVYDYLFAEYLRTRP